MPSPASVGELVIVAPGNVSTGRFHSSSPVTASRAYTCARRSAKYAIHRRAPLIVCCPTVTAVRTPASVLNDQYWQPVSALNENRVNAALPTNTRPPTTVG